MNLKNKNDHQIIIEFTNRFLAETGRSRASWLRSVLLENLIKSRKLDEASIADANEFVIWFRALEKRVERCLKGSQIPEDWRYEWIASLGHYSNKVRSILTQRINANEALDSNSKNQPANLDRVTASLSDVLRNAEPAYDGLYDENDDPEKLSQLASSLAQLGEATKQELNRITRVCSTC